MTRTAIAFNGKFLSAATTGVHRVAHELLTHLDQRLLEDPDVAAERRWSIIKPRDAFQPLPLRTIQSRTGGVLTWQPWEQGELPIRAGRAMLVNLCNLAPLVRPGVVMIHDAQVFLSPESYSAAFRAWYRFALPRIGRSARLILTVSEFSRRQLAEFRVAPYEKIAVLHNGADHLRRVAPDASIVARLGLRTGAYVVALANVQRHKNIGILLEAFARPGLAGERLILIGRASAADFAHAGHAAPDNVTFAGAVSDAEMRSLIEEAGCLAFPSTTEGFGLPPLEAMSLGCPVVIAPRGALPEVCGSAALTAEPEDAAAWEAAIVSILGSPSFRSQLGDLGRAQASLFEWRKSAERLSMLIRQAADA